ncbi:MAG: penicillin-insensitive murein endopeptidase [Nannocystis sp.]|nr:penicillin-insensitive murein endopeptidase [Nannocystis sp.]
MSPPRSPAARTRVFALTAALHLSGLACAGDPSQGEPPRIDLTSSTAAHDTTHGDATAHDATAHDATAHDDTHGDTHAGPELPPTLLPLTLLATLADDDPTRATATLRDDETGAFYTLHPGQSLFTDVELVTVGRGWIELRRAGEHERLDLPQSGVRLVDQPGAASEAPDDDDPGVLRRGVQLGPGPHHFLKRPDNAWGERASVAAIQRAITTYARQARGGPKVKIGDISRRGGGYFPPHLSHRSGRDVDVGYVLRGADPDDPRFRAADASNLDLERTWSLLRAFIGTGHVRVIFVDTKIQRLLYDHARERGVSEQELDLLLQYPRGEGHGGGLIRHFRGHRDHFHVRFGAR